MKMSKEKTLFFYSAESKYNNEKEIKRHISIKINEKKIKFAY